MSAIVNEIKDFIAGADKEVASVFEREDHAIVARTEKVYHEVSHIFEKIDSAVTSSPAGETIAEFVARVKALF